MLPTDVEGFDSLLSWRLDLRWSWNHAADKLWRQLDSALWDLTQIRGWCCRLFRCDKLQRILQNPEFRKDVEDQLQAKRQSASEPACFKKPMQIPDWNCVAYFSMDIHVGVEALPIIPADWGMWPEIN